ncbi:MAG TPA: dihydropteroate synthase [Candidatus Desulfaltia sp.]|nr:dihydropteroate synthase [Candidatus Desulfaltia sp.]
MVIVGERLNSSWKKVAQALQNRDEAFLLGQAKRQEQAGSSYIDINAAILMDGEIEALRWAIPLLQKSVNVPLALDTPNPETMTEALKIHQGRPLLNSLTGESRCLEALLPLVREFKPRVIALCLDEDGPPESSDRALALAEKLAGMLTHEGLRPEDIFIDPLVRPIGVNDQIGALFLESLSKIKTRLSGFTTIAGLSNVSFGLPERRLLNRTLLVLALQAGLDAVICDPLDGELIASLRAAQALLGKDRSLKNYLKFIREKSKAGLKEP